MRLTVTNLVLSVIRNVIAQQFRSDVFAGIKLIPY